jgi:ceramide glucosyltransferase
MTAHLGIVWAGSAIAAAAAIYSVIAAIAVSWRLKLEAPSAAGPAPAISILKPLCGDEHDLYGCLRSFFDQHYPRFQIVLGVSDGDDPAIAVVKRLQQEFSQVDARLVIDRRQHGSSRKISNLINMFPHAGHDCLVISDSDVRVAPDYLSRLAPPLLDASVGIVTCAYRGVSQGGLWSLLGSFFINEWFIP